MLVNNFLTKVHNKYLINNNNKTSHLYNKIMFK